MQFRTEINQIDSGNPIDYSSQIFLMGSCFSESMALKTRFFGFENLVNPFGIIFNPRSMEKLLRRSLEGVAFGEPDVFFFNGRWQCFDVHSELGSAQIQEILDRLNHAAACTREFLINATHIFLTLGTAWVYKSRQSGETVANCHKVPQSHFEKELISADEVRSLVQAMVDLIATANPTAELIFTVSPVRHIKDGFVENQRSKSNLIAGLHEAIAGKEHVFYFPSYEIIMDDLRDYRFYADDLIHPSERAVEYIWTKFTQSWISDSARGLMAKVESVRRAQMHRSFDPDSEAHKNFLIDLKVKEEELVRLGVRL